MILDEAAKDFCEDMIDVLSQREIAHRLTVMGYRTLHGRPISQRNVSALLTSRGVHLRKGFKRTNKEREYEKENSK